MAVSESQPVTDVEQTTHGDVAVFRWDPVSKTQAVLIYEGGVLRAPIEQRVWRSSKPATADERAAVLASFDPHGKQPLTDDARRSVQWGEIHADFRAFTNVDRVDPLEQFPVPTPQVVSHLLEAKVLPDGFRNSRDMQAHATELRAAQEYLLAVYRDKSMAPMAQVAASLQVTVPTARNLIDRARRHGYLTRTQGLGGELTDKAMQVASAFHDAYELLFKANVSLMREESK